MCVKTVILVLLGASRLWASSASVSLDDFRINLEDASRQIQAQKGEIELLHDKVASLQAAVDACRLETAESGGAELEHEKNLSLEKRINQIEKNHKALIGDLKTLKDHLNESTLQLVKCEESLSKLDAQLNSDVKTLKNSMQTMLSLLQGDKIPASKNYTVKSGDSLGKIAQEHHTSTKKLKELNQLDSDQIAIGQKLQIP